MKPELETSLPPSLVRFPTVHSLWTRVSLSPRKPPGIFLNYRFLVSSRGSGALSVDVGPCDFPRSFDDIKLGAAVLPTSPLSSYGFSPWLRGDVWAHSVGQSKRVKRPPLRIGFSWQVFPFYRHNLVCHTGLHVAKSQRVTTSPKPIAGSR